MTPRSIVVDLPSEPALGSVVLVELADSAWVSPARTELFAFQRLGESEGGQPWRVVGRDPMHAAWSWAQLIGLADGRPIRVLWEPVSAEEPA